MESKLVLQGSDLKNCCIPFDIPPELGHYGAADMRTFLIGNIQASKAQARVDPSTMIGFYIDLGWKTLDLCSSWRTAFI
jgi:hypothetical protein